MKITALKNQVVYKVEIEDSGSESDESHNSEKPAERGKVNPIQRNYRKKKTKGRRPPVIDALNKPIDTSVNKPVPSKSVTPQTIVTKKTTSEQVETLEVEEIAVETGRESVANLAKWQRLIGNYQMTDIGDIIDELSEKVFDYPDKSEYHEALAEAQDYQFQLSLKSRQRVKIKKDLNDSQFKKRAEIDYDRKETDEHYRVVDLGHKNSEIERKMKREERPKQENYGTKRYLPHLHAIPTQPSGPEDWLK